MIKTFIREFNISADQLLDMESDDLKENNNSNLKYTMQ
jgi:FtsZ-binding cell division protein ZapB